MKLAFATPSLALGTSQFVTYPSRTKSPRPTFAVARHRGAWMMAELPESDGGVSASLATDSGEMIVDPPLSSAVSEQVAEPSADATSTEPGASPSATDAAAGGASAEAFSGEESSFAAQSGLMGEMDDDADLDVDEILAPETPGYWRNRAVIKEAQQKFKVHETDCGSPEFQIATLTKRIEYITLHLKTNPKDFSSTRGLLKMVATRRRLLKYLKKNDAERFNNIVSGLNIRISQKLRNL